MDEASIEVEIEYDTKNGRVVLSGLEPVLVRSLKKKLSGKKRVTMQPFEEGFVVSEGGIFMSLGDEQGHRIGYA